MKLTDKPAQIAVPFASSGDKDTLPVNATQDTKEKGRAAWDSGFPPLTMTAIAAGGIPPSGKDFNGVLNSLSAGVRFAMAGGLYPFSADFSTAIGGYPLGAILVSADGSKVWWNVSDANTTDPDSDKAAGWKNLLHDPDGLFLKKDQNLADLQNKGTARENLELNKVGNWPAVQANGGLHSSGNHRYYMDWNDGLYMTVDSTDVGMVFTTNNPPTPAQSNSYPMWGGNLNEDASITVISSVLQGNVGDFLYGPMFRTTLKARGGDQDFKDGASFFMRIVEHVGTLAYGELVFDGFSSVQSFVFDQNGQFHANGDVHAGNAWLATDGNIYGGVWGGYLSNWIAGQIDTRIGNNNNWINQSFISGQRQASAQWSGRVGANGLQLPAGCVAIGAKNNGSSDVANMSLLYAAEQICINGNWMTIGLA